MFTLLFHALMSLYRNSAINFSAGDLFQYAGFLFNIGFKKGIKAALCQQHGTGKTFKIHSGFFFNNHGNPPDLVFNNTAVLVSFCNLVFSNLQYTFRLFFCSVLTPVANKTSFRGFKTDLGKTFPGLPRHNIIIIFGNFTQSRGRSVQGQADSIQYRGLTRSSRPGQGKNTISKVIGIGKINLPFTLQ